MRIIFAGTPQPAVPALLELLQSDDHQVVAVLTQPDARVGRGRKVRPSPVREVADKHGIEVLTPNTLREGRDEESDAAIARLNKLQPDCVAVVAYGNLVPPELLELPEHGWVNLHFSLLPQWRGAAPVQAAIAAGDDISGATTFRIEEGLDTGPVLGRITETIKPTDTSEDLLTRLATSGSKLLSATMDGLAAGVIVPVAQEEDGVSHVGKILPEEARVNWTLPAHVIDRRIRAHTPAPGAWTMLGEDRLKLGPVSLTDDEEQLEPGVIRALKGRVLVGTGTDPVQLGGVQAPGKKMMDATAWANGARPDGSTVQ